MNGRRTSSRSAVLQPILVALVLLLTGASIAGQDAPTSVPLADATFAGGCFWSMQLPFEALPGVVSTTVGYTGGQVANPTYAQVSRGGTGHVEAVHVRYDPARVSYETLLDTFWHNVDPLTADRQFCDVGPQYRSVIFVNGEEQQRLAVESKVRLEASGRFQRPLATEIRPAGPFYPAEEEHQDYAKKNPGAYGRYRQGCGRDERLRELWGQTPSPAGRGPG